MAIKAVKRFLDGRRQLYAAPTSEQVGKFWFEVSQALEEGISRGYLKKNESEMFIEKPGTEQRIKAKTSWNADMLRGDYADDLYLDEWQIEYQTGQYPEMEYKLCCPFTSVSPGGACSKCGKKFKEVQEGMKPLDCG